MGITVTDFTFSFQINYDDLAVGDCRCLCFLSLEPQTDHAESCEIMADHAKACPWRCLILPESAWFCLKVPDFAWFCSLRVAESAWCPEGPRTKKCNFVFNEMTVAVTDPDFNISYKHPVLTLYGYGKISTEGISLNFWRENPFKLRSLKALTP